MRLTRTLRGFALAGALTWTAGSAAAQTGQCDVIETREVVGRTVAGALVLDVAGPLLVRCDDGTELRADSAVIYEERGLYELYRNVSVRDAERDVRAEQGVYRDDTRHARMTGDVVYRDLVRNTVLRGPELDYFREMPGRAEARVVATGRPRLVTRSEDPAAADSTVIDADRITTVGETLLNASGEVVIRRPDLTGRSRTARYDSDRGVLDLSGDAVLEGEEFTLSAENVTAELPGDALERVSAAGQARLAGEELTVTGQDIDLFFEDDLLQRLVARGAVEGEQATALSEVMHLEADSIDALLPDQLLEEVVAIGNALAVHQDTVSADTLPPLELQDGRTLPISQDWMRGDTVRAYFARAPDRSGAESDTIADPAADPAPGAEDVERQAVELSRLVASGSAGALFRSRDEPGDRAVSGEAPSISYVTGGRIEIEMQEGEMHLAHVDRLRRGIFLEPLPNGEADAGGADETEAPDEAPEPSDVRSPDPEGMDPDEAASQPRQEDRNPLRDSRS